MTPMIISLGELLVEIMRTEVNVPHGEIGKLYRGPYPSGAPAIFIDSAARMGVKFGQSTGFIGVVGKDDFGKSIVEKLRVDGVDISKIRVEEGKTTGIAFNQYNSDGSRKFIFAAGAAGDTSINDLEPSYFKEVKSLHIMGSALSISENSKDACYKALQIARDQNPNVIVSFDPNLRPEMLPIKKILEICQPILENTNILLPSGEEAEMLAGEKGDQACLTLMQNGIKTIILKQGKEGCKIFNEENPNGHQIPGFKAKEVDPTGAGDSFGGAFIAAYLGGWKIEKAAKFANAVGALKVEFFGPMPNSTYEEAVILMENGRE